MRQRDGNEEGGKNAKTRDLVPGQIRAPVFFFGIHFFNVEQKLVYTDSAVLQRPTKVKVCV